MNEKVMTEPKGDLLIVDDNPMDIELLARILTNDGYIVHLAAQGELALQFVQSTIPDLILLDVKMPTMDGYQVCQRLRLLESTRDIPIIFMTGAAETQDKIKGFQAGAVDYIVKPFQAEEILARVKTHLTLHVTQKQLAAQNARLLQANDQLAREIGEHKQTEAALRESEARLRALINYLPLEFWAMDSNLRYTMQNAVSLKHYGIMVGKRVEELDVPAAVKAEWMAEDLQVLQGKILHGEYERETAGERRIYENIMAPVMVEESVVGIVGVTLDVTERKRAEEELAHERHLMRALMDTVPVRIYFKDTASRFMRVNRAWAKQYGLSDPAQAVGKTDFDFMSAEDAQQRFEDEKSIIESGRSILNQEETIKRPDGRVVWSSTSKLALHDKNGHIVGTFGVTQDITARKQAEIALHESEVRYRSLFEDSPISLWEEDFSLVKKYLDDLRASGITDPRTYFASHSEAIAHCAGLVKVLDVNKASLALVGASSKDELLVGLSKLLADEALIVFREELIALAEGKREFESEEIHRTFSGQVRNVTLHLSVAPGFERSLGKVLVSVVDVTERKRAEDALRESEERLRTLINAMPDIVVFKDGEGRYLESNDFNLRFFQIEQVDYRGKKDSELAQASFFLRSVLATWKETDEAAWQARAIRRSDETIPRPNGPPMVFDLIKVPMFYPDGRRKGLVVVGRDITERKRAEEELRKAYADLERRVEERTEELVRAYARSREENAERKRTQEALKQSERKFRSIVEQSQDGIVLTDEQGTIIEWNQSQERLTGLTRADVMGRPFWDVQFQVATDEERAILGTYERFKSEAIEFFATGKSPWLNELQEREIQLPDRMRRIIQIMPFAIETDHGRMRASISRDITDRKRAEEALRESEERYHAIVEGYDGLIYICSQDQRIEFMNQRFIEQTGRNAIGEVCYKALHERDSICPWCVNDRVFNGETVHWQVQSPRDNRWYYVVDTPIHHANGSMSKLAMILDITPRVEVEQALRESEAKLRAIVYGSPIPQFVIDESHTVIHWNRALEEISGIRAEEVIGTKQHWKAFYPEERPCLSDLIVDGHVERIPDWYRGKYGKSKLVTDAYEVTDYIPMPGKEGKWLHFTAAAITDSRSNRIGAVETLVDITERKKAEDALNKNNQPGEGSADE